MHTDFRKDITIRQLCEGFVYNEFDEKGLFGLMVNLSFSRNISVIIFMVMEKEMLL